MAFQRPTLATISERILADIDSRLEGLDARLRRSVLNVISKSLSGACHGLYGYLDEIARQSMPDTAEDAYLERWAAVWGISRSNAVAAAGPITVTGISGSTIPALTLLQRSDGAEFLTTSADVDLVDGSAEVQVAAVVSGTVGNTVAGIPMTFMEPIDGVNTSAVVAAAGLSGGTEAETNAALRARLIARIQAPPHGGAAFDYVAWATSISGVTRAWCFPQIRGAGTVDVYIVRDNDDSNIPSDIEVQAVQVYLETVRPVTADVLVLAPVPDALDFTISGLNPNDAATKAAVTAELADLLLREAIPSDGAGQGIILLSHIREAISVALGEIDHVLVSPAADVEPALGHMAVMGTVTWA